MNINLTIIGQSLSFLFFVWFCMKYVWPVILTAMQEREQRIADGLAAADRASHDLELAQERAVQRLTEAKTEAASIIDAANKRANQIIEEAKNAARDEGERLKAAAQAEIEQELNRAKEMLRSQVAGLALEGAEKVLQGTVDKKAHTAMLDKLAESL